MIKIIFKFKNSINGIKQGLKDNSLKAEFLWLFVGTLVLYFVDVDITKKLFGIFLLLLLLVVEMMNTAIEMLCNKITTDYDVDIKNIKDVASGAVLILLTIQLLFVIYLICF